MNGPTSILCPLITREDIERVCIATNDSHPLHLDREFARAAGFRDVVVPAHLLIGWIGHYIEEWCGDARKILALSVRFSSPVWPGDQIELDSEISPATAEGMRNIKVTAKSQEGIIVGSATAQCTV